MAEEKTVEDSELSAIIAAEIRSADNYGSQDLVDRRTLAIEYMRGEMRDTPARPNGSQQTSRDFADTVHWILPGIVRLFTASDQMVKYDKVAPGNDEWEQDASEYTNYTFLRENEGYKILYNATYDALQMGDGLVCSYWEPERTETKIFRDKTEMELALLMQEEGWQPTGVAKPGKPTTDLADDPMTGEIVEVEVPTLTVKMMKVNKAGKICDVTCKPDNLYLNASATEIETARFVAYRHDDKTRSDLMEMAKDYGWKREDIEDLPATIRGTKTETDTARTGDKGINFDSPVRSGDEIDLFECYMRADMDGDGIAELIQVWWAGDTGAGKVLGYEEWEGEIPYTHIPCYPVPHEQDSQSVFDRTHDIARVKTVLLRQLIDNLYATNMPMREVEEGSVKNPDILINPKFGGLIWKKASTAPIISHSVPFVADKALLGLQYFDEMTAKRTGVSRTTMALDPEALQNQSATANQNNKDAAYSQIELVARNMAEYGGWQKFFSKRLKLAIQHKQIRSIPSNRGEGGFLQVDTGQWDPNMAVTINVGLGTGSRDRDMSMLNLILNGQVAMADRLAAGGFAAKAVEFIPKIRSTAVKLAESSGIRNPEDFYPKIDEDEVKAMVAQASQPKPSPEEAKAAMDAKAKDAQAQRDHEYRMAQLAEKSKTAEVDARVKFDLGVYQTNKELELRRWQIEQEMAMNERLGLHKNAMAADVQVGGDPG